MVGTNARVAFSYPFDRPGPLLLRPRNFSNRSEIFVSGAHITNLISCPHLFRPILIISLAGLFRDTCTSGRIRVFDLRRFNRISTTRTTSIPDPINSFMDAYFHPVARLTHNTKILDETSTMSNVILDLE
ncbi:hypothetical protein Zmor_009170 [Zophobas morio]|uniref:Uncharacterized protein n=1 Tax=Zophobas morio TaxID=2755281 RepID=A0AA38IIM2_9CUCU|nr:hypothetical protein Zmor_009170 [Zophobas morio]